MGGSTGEGPVNVVRLNMRLYCRVFHTAFVSQIFKKKKVLEIYYGIMALSAATIKLPNAF